MQRNVLNALKNNIKLSNKNFYLSQPQKRSFFFRSSGDYDFVTPMLNFGLWAGTAFGVTVGVTAYRYSHEQAIKKLQKKSADNIYNNESKREENSAINKPKM